VPAELRIEAVRRRLKMWYFIFFTLGAVAGGLAAIMRYETKCRDCGVRENCEEFP
jgi:hypothetical protein